MPRSGQCERVRPSSRFRLRRRRTPARSVERSRCLRRPPCAAPCRRRAARLQERPPCGSGAGVPLSLKAGHISFHDGHELFKALHDRRARLIQVVRWLRGALQRATHRQARLAGLCDRLGSMPPRQPLSPHRSSGASMLDPRAHRASRLARASIRNKSSTASRPSEVRRISAVGGLKMAHTLGMNSWCEIIR